MSFFSKPKIKKSQAPPKSSYTIHDFHNKDIQERGTIWQGQDHFQICSIDPGAKNLGMRIERRYHKGTYEPLVYLRMDLQVTEEDEVNCTVYKKLSIFLRQYLPYFRETHLFVIERQLPENYRAVRISQHIITFLMHNLEDSKLLPLVYEVESKLKYRMLGAPTQLNQRALKKDWGPRKAREILETEKDLLSLNRLDSEKKKDDLGDTVLLRRVLELIIFPGMASTSTSLL